MLNLLLFLNSLRVFYVYITKPVIALAREHHEKKSIIASYCYTRASYRNTKVPHKKMQYCTNNFQQKRWARDAGQKRLRKQKKKAINTKSFYLDYNCVDYYCNY